ncbi:MAG: M3 family oligoendopeptidase [Bacillota bacterium]|jgi:oligoendopeptidase F
MLKDLQQTWDLDVIFSGGSSSPEFAQFLEQTSQQIAALAARVRQERDLAGWESLLLDLQEVIKRQRHAGAFVSCLNAQNVKDQQAQILSGRVKQMAATFASVLTAVDKQITEMSDSEWQQLLHSPNVEPIAFNLNERRERAKEMLSPEQETLVNSLSVDGYHGWSDLYALVSGRLTIPVEDDGQTKQLSAGQAANRMSNPNREVRERLHEAWESAWASIADHCALALNHLAGFRLNLYAERGWDSVLTEPCRINRMSIDTLNAMWAAVDNKKPLLKTYLERKRQVLGVNGLTWNDIGAPLGNSATKLSYDEAAQFIVEQFGKFNPEMADFATMAFEQRWIESEDRPGKRAGGFCTSFPVKQQSRIFVTFSGSMGNLSTLAHELGHGYHQSIMNELPPLAQQYAMNVAETASTFAEMITFDAALKHAANEQEKLSLIEDKLHRAVSLLMNIQSRFLFETSFYAERRQGMVSVKRLNELMVAAQKEAFADMLVGYHPHFWASKLHFYNTSVPFYNFPYTFGFLFSAGVYAKALEEGPAFREKYVALLRDTGRMRVEDLAKRHLGADLTRPDFWEASIDLVMSDLDEFLRLTSK